MMETTKRRLVDVAQELYPGEDFSMNVLTQHWADGSNYDSFWRHNSQNMIDVGRLFIDYSYQRSCINMALINRCCLNFNVELMNHLHVNKRTFCITDGQHTGIICVRRGIQKVPVVFTDNDTREDEANLFLGHNSTTNRVTPRDKFYAMVTAGDVKAIKIQEILNGLGLKVVKYTGRNSWQSINYIYAILDAYEKYPDCIEKTMRCVFRLTENRTQSNVHVFAGVLYLISKGFDLESSIDELIGKTHRMSRLGDAVSILDNMYTDKRRTDWKKPMPCMVAEIIVDCLNYGKRKSSFYRVPVDLADNQ